MAETPTTFELRSALIVARLVEPGGSSVSALTAAFGAHATGGLYRSQDFDRGRDLLESVGLLTRTADEWISPTDRCVEIRELADDVATEVLLQLVLAAQPPLWLFAAIEGEAIQWENVPDRDFEALRGSIVDPERREALLINLGRTVDEASRRRLGEAGELHVVEKCRSYLLGKGRDDLAREVRQVSTLSDQLGYDVTSPDTTGHRHRLEVKATTRRSTETVDFYISRNEAKVGSKDSQWALVAVTKDVITGAIDIVGWCRAADFADALPIDPTTWGHWSSALISMDETTLIEGLPLDR